MASILTMRRKEIVIYLHFLYKSWKVVVSIVTRKSRLLTVKNKMTIPHVELNGLLYV